MGKEVALRMQVYVEPSPTACAMIASLFVTSLNSAVISIQLYMDVYTRPASMCTSLAGDGKGGWPLQRGETSPARPLKSPVWHSKL